MASLSYIVALGTALPAHKHSQQTILEFMLQQHTLNAQEQTSLQNLYAKSGIETRYSVLPDFDLKSTQAPLLFAQQTPNLEARLELYYQHALPLAASAAQTCLSKVPSPAVTHLITVSCTGMMAPGLDIELVKYLNLSTDTERSAVQFMGCYAAMHALKQAHYICMAQPKANVLIVCVELCTLHFQNSTTRDNLLSNAIFADGAAAALICGSHEPNKPAIALHHFFSRLDFKGFNDMGWYIKTVAFQMRLTSQIPTLIKTQFKQLMEQHWQLLENARFTANAALYDWAIHPGGKKILDVIESDFELSTTALVNSRKILNEYGNMSSVTLLFILDQFLVNPEPDKPLVIAAFGPGLTTEVALARYV